MADDEGVLGNLPKSRPGKRSAKRDSAPNAKRGASGSTPAKTSAGRPAKAAGKAEAAGKRAAKPPPAPRQPPTEPLAPEPRGDAVEAVVRTAAGLAVTGVRVAGAVTQELLRRLPRP